MISLAALSALATFAEATDSKAVMDDKRSALPVELRELLNSVGNVLKQGSDVDKTFQPIPAMLDGIPAELLTRAEADIVQCAELYRYWPEPTLFARLLHRELAHSEQLERVAGLEHLFVFHRDGRLREAALRKFNGPISSPFMFAAISWRLNDWVAEVRTAAVECATRCFPQTDPLVIARAALALLSRRATWSRWITEGEAIDAVFSRPDVISALAMLMIQRPTGPNATVLRVALRDPNIDSELPRIASDAVQPATRAVAYQTLIAGEANWPQGWRWRWVDKTIGARRRETVFASRPITIATSPEAYILQALTDPSGVVRSTAMSGLIRHRDIINNVDEIARRFIDDSASGVRERAKFILKD